MLRYSIFGRAHSRPEVYLRIGDIVMWCIIEEMRITLIETAQKYGMNSKETIQCSQELDILLNTRIKEEMIFGRYLENSRM